MREGPTSFRWHPKFEGICLLSHRGDLRRIVRRRATGSELTLRIVSHLNKSRFWKVVTVALAAAPHEALSQLQTIDLVGRSLQHNGSVTSDQLLNFSTGRMSGIHYLGSKAWHTGKPNRDSEYEELSHQRALRGKLSNALWGAVCKTGVTMLRKIRVYAGHRTEDCSQLLANRMGSRSNSVARVKNSRRLTFSAELEVLESERHVVRKIISAMPV